MKRKTVSFNLSEHPEADTLRPLHSTLKTVLDYIGHAKGTQAAQYAKTASQSCEGKHFAQNFHVQDR